MFSISEDLLVLDASLKGIVVLLEQSELLFSEETREATRFAPKK